MSTADYERGQTEERHRIGTILSFAEARQQPQLAAQLAFKQSTPAVEALGILRSFQTAADTDAGSASSWDAIADRLNAEAGFGSSQGGRSAAADASDGWNGITDKLNAESRVR